jgi:hypothetical protein
VAGPTQTDSANDCCFLLPVIVSATAAANKKA